MRTLIAGLLLLVMAPVLAQDVPVPRPRPDPAAVETTVETPDPAPPEAAAPDVEDGAQPKPDVPLPRPRPEGDGPAEPVDIGTPEDEVAPATAENVEAEVPPAPPRVYQTACPALLLGMVEAEPLEPIAEGACGERSPLSVTAVTVNGRRVPLSAPVTTNCEMASALPAWLAAVDGFARAREDARIEEVRVGTSYMCRNVNRAETGRLSEHAFANGLDIVGFALDDGRTIDVLTGWPGTPEQGSRLLRFAHDAACGTFTTTLGPEANALHRDHFHIDLGCHGRSCTAQLCE